jgi:cathepsin X
MRDVLPAIQTLINCGHAGSCNGGDANAANAWVYKNGIPDVTCQQYQAKNMECTAFNTCANCDPSNGCCKSFKQFIFSLSLNSSLQSFFPLVAVANYPKITLSEFGSAYGDEAIMSEIYARGPVAANINAECIETYTGGIAPYDNCKPNLNNHVIQLNGWGTENGTDYWIGRNSWGTYWGELWFLFENTNRFNRFFCLFIGEHGFFRIVRGGNYTPKRGFWAVPNIPEF